MKMRILSNFEDESLRECWDKLESKYFENFFQSYVCARTWWKNFGNRHRKLNILTFLQNNKIVGISPFYIEKIRLGKIVPTKIWRWIGSQYISPDHMDFIYKEGTGEEIAKKFVHYLETHARKWDVIHLQSIRENSTIIEILEALIQKSKISMRQYGQGEICPYIQLPDTYDEFFRELKSSFRYRIRRGYKEWKRRGCTFRISGDPKDRLRAFQDLVRLHRLRWQMQGKEGNFNLPKVLNFHQEILQASTSSWKPIFFEIVGQEGVVASLYGFQSSTKFYYYQMGYDPKFRDNRLIPGKILIDMAIQYAISNNLKEFDLLRGNEPYKYDWAPWVHVRHEPTYLIYHKSLQSQVYANYKILRARISNKIKHRGGLLQSTML